MSNSPKYKTKFIDRLLNRIGTIFFANPSDLKTEDGFEVGKGFYHRPHSRENIRNADTSDFARLTAVHYFRMAACEGIAGRISFWSGLVSVVIGTIAMIIKFN